MKDRLNGTIRKKHVFLRKGNNKKKPGIDEEIHMYFNYHATAHRLIRDGKLLDWRITESWKGISPALVLFFDDEKHPIMPIREHMWEQYWDLLAEWDAAQHLKPHL